MTHFKKSSTHLRRIFRVKLREASTVTPQVFSLFNSQMAYGRAIAMAQRLVDLQLSRPETIERAFQWAFARQPRPRETAVCLQHWRQMESRHATLSIPPTEYPREVLREAIEENTGERFTFCEPLEVYADFVPDLQPSDVTTAVRALAEVCLVIFNANEFLYVD